MSKIAITTTTFGEYDNSYIKICEDKGFDIVINPYGRKMQPEELVEFAKEAVGIVAGTEFITKDTLKKLPNLKVISRCGTGMDNIDLETARSLNIKVFNTPDAPTLAVAELTLGLILALLRKINTVDRDIRSSKWEKRMGNLLSGKKVGIVGFGRIGRKVAELLATFKCDIAYADPFIEDNLLGFNKLSKEDLLKWADIVSLHVSAKEIILGEKELNLMNKGSWLINVSRGGVVDEKALYKFLKDGWIYGAALDVFEKEPYNGPLKELDNIILTSHIGSYAKEVRIKMEKEAVENLLKGLKEG
jgi:D-3-phosphoglycerate dehydrogenase